ACLADSTESLTDVVMAAPVLQAVAGKLLSLVRDQVPGGCADLANHVAQKTADLLRGRLSAKEREAKHTSRVMIQYHSQPPAERPALRQRERQPRGPEPSRCRHGGEIGVPEMVGVLGCNPTGGGRALLAGCRWRRRTLTAHATDAGRAQVQAS